MQGRLRLLTTGIGFIVLAACSGQPITDTKPNERQSATIEGIVREVGTETPVADVNVFVVRTSDQPQISTTTDADGHFALEGLDAGRHLVALVREGYVVPGRQEISGYPFRVTTAQRITNTVFHMVPTGTGFRDHYRTRVKKNIDFGEIGTSVGFTPIAMDSEMEALLSGGVDAMSQEPALALAATGSEGAAAQAAAPKKSAALAADGPAESLDLSPDDGDGADEAGRLWKREDQPSLFGE